MWIHPQGSPFGDVKDQAWICEVMERWKKRGRYREGETKQEGWERVKTDGAHQELFTVLASLLIIYTRMKKQPVCRACHLSRKWARLMTLDFSLNPVGFRAVFTNHRVAEFLVFNCSENIKKNPAPYLELKWFLAAVTSARCETYREAEDMTAE